LEDRKERVGREQGGLVGFGVKDGQILGHGEGGN
jgi:hypothetical protein